MQRNILHTFATKRLRQIQSICAVVAVTLGSLLTGPARVAYAEIPDANTCKNPRLAAVVVRPGDPLAVNSEMAFTNTVYTIPYSGTVSAGQCTALQTGAVWGPAFEPSSRNLYMSAVMIAGAGFGTLGSGGIYRSEEGKPTSTDAFADLDALGFATRPANFPASNAARGLTGNPTASWEGAINQIVRDEKRDEVGRMGLGDIDVSPDGKTLWTVNLFSRSLISITRAGDNTKPTAADIKSIAIPAPAENGTNICSDEFRPWALEVTDNSVYVGVTCTDENHVGAEPGEDVNKDLRGLIYQYNIAGNSWSLLSITSENQAKPYFQLKGYRWNHPNPNNNAYNRQLFLADLELDDDGSIVVGMADRWPMMGSKTLDRDHQPWAKGDLLRICNVANTLTLEKDGTCPNGGGQGKNGEYYNDQPGDPDFRANHPENQTGGIALLPGANSQVVSMSYNPVDPGGTGYRSGYQIFSNQSGEVVHAAELVKAANEYGYGKAGGLGDVEVLCDAAPLALDESEEPDAPKAARQIYLPFVIQK